MISVSDIVGITGSLITLFAYYLLQADRLGAYSVSFLFMNALGSIFIIYSLLFSWNYGSFLMEISWLVITIWSFIKHGVSRKNPALEGES